MNPVGRRSTSKRYEQEAQNRQKREIVLLPCKPKSIVVKDFFHDTVLAVEVLSRAASANSASQGPDWFSAPDAMRLRWPIHTVSAPKPGDFSEE